MIIKFDIFEQWEPEFKSDPPLNIDTLKKLASDSDIKTVDYKVVNRIALYVHNQFKKVPNFKTCLVLIVDDPYKKWGLTKYNKMQFILDKRIPSAYYTHYNAGNLRYLQIVCCDNDLEKLFHEIQHALYYQAYGTDKYVDEAWDLNQTMLQLGIKMDEHPGDYDYNHTYCFLFHIYVLYSSEIESNIIEVYQQLLKMKTTSYNFKENVSKATAAITYMHAASETETGEYLKLLKTSPKFRVDFFSQVNHLLNNIREPEKIKLKRSNLLRRLFTKEKRFSIKYKNKISQEEADEMAKFWVKYIQDRSKVALEKIRLIKYLFK